MEEARTIAVLGGGNGAHAMAADLSIKGLSVNICEAPDYKDSFMTTLKKQEISLIDPWEQEKIAKLNMATTSFQEAIEGIKYIMMIVPAMGHIHFFNHIIPYLEDGQTVILWPGNYAGLLFANVLNKKGIKKNITFAEAHTLPWAARLVAPAKVQIFAEVWKLLLGVFPAKNTDQVINDMKDIYPVVPSENILAASLNNLNPIVHPIGSVLNAGWVDTLKDDFYFYKLGTTISISRVIKAVYEEVERVSNTIGVKMLAYPEEAFRSKSTIMAYYARAPINIEEVAAKVSGPTSMQHRYITEDVPYGLVPISRLARKFGVTVPVIDGVIDLAAIINQTNYRQEGRSLEELGIADLNIDELVQVLRNGF
jgi:opine dehydrogenase